MSTVYGPPPQFPADVGTPLFAFPRDVVVAPDGSQYISDAGSNRIFRLASDGGVALLSVNGFLPYPASFPELIPQALGSSSLPQIAAPSALALDSSGVLYFCDTGNQRICKVTSDGTISVIAGGSRGLADGIGSAAKFDSPSGIAVSGDGTVYIADTGNSRICKVSLQGEVSTLAGGEVGFADGTGLAARFDHPCGLAIDSDGHLYVADTSNNRIRRISSDGSVLTIAGAQVGFADGHGAAARFHFPRAIVIGQGGLLYIADEGNACVRRMTTDGLVTSVAGGTVGVANGSGAGAQFDHPMGLAIGPDGTLHVADSMNARIRRVTLEGQVTTERGGSLIFADGEASRALLGWQDQMVVDKQGNLIFVDSANNWIRKMSPDGHFSTLAGSFAGYADGAGASAEFSHPDGLALDDRGVLYVADRWNQSIRKVTPDGVVTTLAGGTLGSADGQGAAAQFTYPSCIAVDHEGNVFVSEYSSSRIRRVSANGQVTTLAGSDPGFAEGKGALAKFNYPRGLAVDGSGNLYVADAKNNRIRKVTPDGVVSTLAGSEQGFKDGSGNGALLWFPLALTMAPDGYLYLLEDGNHSLRRVALDGTVSTVLGGTKGYKDGPASLALLEYAYCLAADGLGNFYIGDSTHIRMYKP